MSLLLAQLSCRPPLPPRPRPLANHPFGLILFSDHRTAVTRPLPTSPFGSPPLYLGKGIVAAAADTPRTCAVDVSFRTPGTCGRGPQHRINPRRRCPTTHAPSRTPALCDLQESLLLLLPFATAPCKSTTAAAAATTIRALFRPAHGVLLRLSPANARSALTIWYSAS